MMAGAWIVLSYLSGAVPYSPLLGRWLLGVNIRDVGDGNPGATNVLRAGGVKFGALAAVLDALKALVPVGIAWWTLGIEGPAMIAVAIAPIAGHAFSPFLRFSGGKAVATTFGTWIALTIWDGPTVLGLMLFYWFKSMGNSGWVVLMAMLSLGAYLLLAKPDPELLAIWLINTLILVYKHRHELRQPPQVKRWLPFLRA